MTQQNDDGARAVARPRLKRSVSLPVLVFYGLGTTIGAGIYVLIGETAMRAGYYAPLAFIFAAILISFTAASYSELAGSFPVSAAEAAYVRAGFGIETMALIVGLLICGSGIVSAATLIQGAAGYAHALSGWPTPGIVIALTLGLGLAVAWGINFSTGIAVLFTVIEIGGLLLIIGASVLDGDRIARDALAHAPAFNLALIPAILSAGLLAFFAFIGFEDMVNIAEEVKRPERTLPLAIALTLGITTLLYVAVVFIAVIRVPGAELGASKAPLSLVFERVTGASGTTVSMIAVIAALNGILAQMIMASRVLYGLSRRHNLPVWLGEVNPLTRTPLHATVLIVAIIFVLALSMRLGRLAETTSSLALMAFTIVNLALWRLKGRPDYRPGGITVPRWVPLAGFAFSGLFLAAELGRRLVF